MKNKDAAQAAAARAAASRRRKQRGTQSATSANTGIINGVGRSTTAGELIPVDVPQGRQRQQQDTHRVIAATADDAHGGTTADPLLERSFEASLEVASVLASVKKKKSNSARDRPLQQLRLLSPDQLPMADAVAESQSSGRVKPSSRKDNDNQSSSHHSLPPPDEVNYGQNNDGDDKEEEADEEPTVEELEPVLSETTTDAACLSYFKDSVRIASQAYCQYVRTVHDDNNSYSLQAGGHDDGGALLSDAELFTVVPVEQFGKTASSCPDVVCYGDTVMLLMSHHKAHASSRQPVMAIGVKPVRHQATVMTYQVGLIEISTETDGQASVDTTDDGYRQWKVLRAIPDALVRVGSAAATASLTSSDRPNRQPTAAVRSNEPILLRNIQTGGVLSLTNASNNTNTNHGRRRHHRLALITDSYNAFSSSPRSMSSSLLLRLQHHDKLVITPEITFLLQPACGAPIPFWMSPSNRPVYLDNSYLLYPDRHRPVFGNDDNDVDSAHLQQQAPKTPRDQEQLVLDEFFGSVLGLEGTFVRTDSAGATMSDVKFHLLTSVQDGDDDDRELDPSLQGLVQGMLTLATDYNHVRHFCACRYPGYEFGNVMQALCEALDRLLQDFMTVIASLECRYRRTSSADISTLRGLHVQVQPYQHAMAVLRRVTETVSDKKGGALLNAVRELKTGVYGGDSLADRILSALLDHGSVPYLNSLAKWVQQGILSDPHGEFMLALDETSDTWDGKYKVRPENVLEGFFATNVAVEQVVATGRYWNSVRACGNAKTTYSDSEVDDVPVPQYTSDVATVSSYIQLMYHRASRSLVRILLEDYNLMGSLRLHEAIFLARSR